MIRCLITYLLVFAGFSISAQVVMNNGAFISAESGAFVRVLGSVNNTSGTIIVHENTGTPAELYIAEDITNDDILVADGFIKLHGNWFNNSSFSSSQGTVFLEGANQLISGSVETNFFNLTLDGSGLKTQEINAFSLGVLDLKHLELQTETFSFYVENTSTAAIQRTSGFVSSLNGGFLSRRTEALDIYLFPVGSTLGVQRYRPVELAPVGTPNNTFEVRLANLDANIEGFDRSLTDTTICILNPFYYHQINRSLGSSSVDLSIYFDELEDGHWSGISNWKQINTQWEWISNSLSSSGSPLSVVNSNNWNDFDDIPYILSDINQLPLFDSIGPICQNELAPILPNVSVNGYSGTWSGVVDSQQVGIQYFVFTPDPNQCALTAELSVEVMGLPEMTGVDELQEILCFGGQGMLSINVLSAPGMLYELNQSGMVTSNEFLAYAGTHDISIMDSNGCVTSDTYLMLEPTNISLTALVDNVLCTNGTGGIDLSISGGSPNYAISWNENWYSEDLLDIPAGVYNAIVTDNNACQDSISLEVIETLSNEPAYIVNNSGTSELTCLMPQIEVEALGGSNFQWSGGDSVNSALNTFSQQGNYIVDYIDSNGCQLQMNIEISEDFSTPLLDIDNITNSTNELSCNEPQIELFGSGADSYVWSDTINSINTTVSAAGEYQVVGMGWNGCVDSISITITSDFDLPNIDIQNLTGTNILDCNTDSIEIQVTGGLSYEWSDGLGVQPSIFVSSAGVYSVIGLGSNGCLNYDSIEVIDLPYPTLTVNSETICSGSSIELLAQASIPGGNYTWSNGLGSSSSVVVSPVSNAFFTVEYELNGCESNTATAIISVIPTPVVSISGSSSICSSQSVTLTGNTSLPGGVYEWLPNGEVSNSITAFPSTTTVYGLIYTLNGCPSETAEFTVDVVPTPFVSLSDVSICEGESATLTALPSIPGGTYNWIPGGASSQELTVSPDSSEIYSVYYSLNGCISQLTSANIFVNPIPDLSVQDISICQGTTGFLNAVSSISGGTYSWVGYGENSSVLQVSPFSTANYSVSYEVNNCSSTTEVALVTVIEQPTLTYTNQGICEGDTISLSVVPSLSGGTYLWLPSNETTPTITIFPEVTSQYQVVYEINGCQSDYETIIVTVDAMPQTTFDVNVTSGCPPLNVIFTNTTSNTSNCYWTINNGTTFNGCSNTSYTFWDEGCYDVMLTTETPNGCPGYMTMDSLICVFPQPEIDFTTSTSQISYGSSEVDFTNFSMNAVDYLWEFGDGSVDTLYTPDTYEYEVNDELFFMVTLTGTTDLGCSDSLQLPINVNQDAIIFAPNTFTPDGDGLNDTWFPTVSNGVDQDFFDVQIFNRWGELIFESESFYDAWDATYQGNQVPIGTYTYRIQYKEKKTEKRKILVGHINLVR